MKKTVLLFQKVAAPFAVIGIVGCVLDALHYEILINGCLVLSALTTFGFVAATVVECIMIAWLFKRTLNFGWLFLDILLVPIVVFSIAISAFTFEVNELRSHARYEHSDFSKDIVVCNTAAWFSGESKVYETDDGVILKRVTVFVGDDGWMPLGHGEYYCVTATDYGFEFQYSFNGKSGWEEEYRRTECIIYENGHYRIQK